MNVKPSLVLASASWISLFVEIWLLLLEKIRPTVGAQSFFLFFFVIAMMASAIYSGKSRVNPEIRVQIGGQIFAEEKGNLNVVRNKGLVLCNIDRKDLNVFSMSGKP